MKLQEVADKVFKGKDLALETIAFYEEDENSELKRIAPDFADEILETHGQCEVEDYMYIQGNRCLLVELKEKK